MLCNTYYVSSKLNTGSPKKGGPNHKKIIPNSQHNYKLDFRVTQKEDLWKERTARGRIKTARFEGRVETLRKSKKLIEPQKWHPKCCLPEVTKERRRELKESEIDRDGGTWGKINEKFAYKRKFPEEKKQISQRNLHEGVVFRNSNWLLRNKKNVLRGLFATTRCSKNIHSENYSEISKL